MSRDRTRAAAETLDRRARVLRDKLAAIEAAQVALEATCPHPERRPGIGCDLCADCGKVFWHQLEPEAA